MHERPPRRLRPALLAAALGAAALPAAARADGGECASRSVPGWPRCSDEPPPLVGDTPDDYGEANDSDGTQYDTNWFFDADAGDTDVVWMRVVKACIQGGGSVVDADPESSTHAAKQAWGEDRVSFDCPARKGETCVIVVSNQIRIRAAWALAGNGRNVAVMRGDAKDIVGKWHTLARTVTVDPSVTTTTTTRDADASGSSGTTTGSSSTSDGASGSFTETTTSNASQETSTSETVTSGQGQSDQAEYTAFVQRSYPAKQVTVTVASIELLDLRAQATVDGIETHADVPYLDTTNVVRGAYVVTPIAGPGTPGGDDPTPPDTGDGGTTPSGDPPPPDEGAGPTTPGGGDGAPPEPVRPGGDDDAEPLDVPPVGGGGTGTAPAGDDGGGATGDGSGATGDDLGGSAPAEQDGTEPPDSGGLDPVEGGLGPPAPAGGPAGGGASGGW